MRAKPSLLLLVATSATWAACAGTPAAPTPPPVAASAPAAAAAPAPAFAYPPARTGDTVDDYHGTRVPDPYRWLEDLDSAETRAWIDAENALTFGYLEKLPARARFEKRLTEVWNYERFTTPWSKHGRYFYFRNSGLQNQPVLMTAARLDADPRILLDPNPLSADGTIALNGVTVTEDGTLMAYALSTAGSDWVDLHVKNVDTGADLPDVIHTRDGNVAWARDKKGFYYVAFDPPAGGERKVENRFPKVRYHRLGTTPDKDELIYDRPDRPDFDLGVGITDDGRWLLLQIFSSKAGWGKVQIHVRDLDRKGSRWLPLVGDFEETAYVVGNIGGRFFLGSDRGAPKSRIVAIDVAHPERRAEIVPEADATLRGAALIHDQIVARYLEDAHARVTVFGLDGKKVREVALPGLGSVDGFSGERQDTETFYSFTSAAAPWVVYHYDLVTGQSQLFRAPKLAFDPAQFVTEQVFATSKDGTRVPIFVSYKKGLERTGQTPTWLYGYGGFDIDETPEFRTSALVWMEAGGLYADAVLRGGGEYGEAWHRAGMMDRKQNVFDDFIAAAEYLVAAKWTSTPHLAINGGSNGGLLVGAVLTQRPDVAGAAVAQVGVMDMLRYQRFTMGWLWAAEWGSSDDPTGFQTVYRYSPLHHLTPGTRYPATLITTADHDDRVFPAHSFKFAAAMQAAQAGPAPVLIRVETRAGHGAGKPVSKQIQEAADMLAFLAERLGMKM